MPAKTSTGPVALLTRLSRLAYLRADPDSAAVSVKTLKLLNSIAWAGGTIGQGELAEAMFSRPNQLVLMLNEAEADGYVERRRDLEDRRRHIVALTEAGRDAIVEGERAFDSLEDELLAGLSEAKRRKLADLLTEALDTIDKG